MRNAVYCPKSELSVSPTDIGFSSDTEVTRYGPCKRDSYIIHYVISGKGFFNGNPVSSGQGFLITPGLLEEYHPSEGDPWTFLWIVAYGDGMKGIFERYGADEKGIFSYGFADKLSDILDYLLSNTDKILGVYEMNALLYRILSNHDKTGDRGEVQKNSQIYLDYASAMIEREFSRGITVREICQKLGVSEPYLFRLFKEKYGKSPKRYISERRLSQSKMLLLETDLSISEIGFAVGYEDVLAFSKFFAHETGKSPTAYRDEMTQKKD